MMNEASWYQMMGISKLVLRNFVIGCFIILLSVIALLTVELRSVNKERRMDDYNHKQELIACKEESSKIAEAKNNEYKALFEETIRNQYKIQAEQLKIKSALSKHKNE